MEAGGEGERDRGASETRGVWNHDPHRNVAGGGQRLPARLPVRGGAGTIGRRRIRGVRLIAGQQQREQDQREIPHRGGVYSRLAVQDSPPVPNSSRVLTPKN